MVSNLKNLLEEKDVKFRYCIGRYNGMLSNIVVEVTDYLRLFSNMSKTLAYLRTSTDKQDLNNQRLEILEYARRNGIHIDDFVEISISSRKSRCDRRIEELLESSAQTIRSSSPS